MNSAFPPSPSSQGTASDSPILGGQNQLETSSRPGTAGGYQQEPSLTSTPTANTTSGAVRRKPARRANTAERRATHNAVERQRRETLNGRFLDLAALLPNLATVRRPSKSSIVNSSIALVHTQRRLRALAGRELRALSAEADALRREVNAWRAAHPSAPPSPSPSALGHLKSEAASTAHISTPERSQDFLSLFAVDELTEDEMSMNESERIAYEMRGGGGGGFSADGEELFGDDDEGQDSMEQFGVMQVQQPQTMQLPTPAPSARSRARATSISGARNAQQIRAQQAQQIQQQQQSVASLAHLQQRLQMNPQQQQQAAAASLLPYHQQQQMQMQQAAAMQQQQMQMHQQALQQQMNGAGGFPQTFLPPSFETIAAAAAGFPQQQQHAQPQTPNEAQEAANKLWNAHLFSAALAAQQQQSSGSPQSQQWGSMPFQIQTPPSSSHGSVSPFGVGNGTNNGATGGVVPNQQFLQQFQRTAAIPNLFDGSSPGRKSATPEAGSNDMDSSSSSNGDAQSPHASKATPSLSISLSNIGGQGSSLPSALASPLHNLSLGTPIGSGGDPFANFTYGSAPPQSTLHSIAEAQQSQHQHQQQNQPVGGGGGYHQYALMSMFI